MSDEDWNTLITQQWFPFISLKRRTIEDIIDYAANGWMIDSLTERIAAEVESMIPSLLTKWIRNKLFKPHFALIKQAAERFIEKDYISATSILYPRIEGLMRAHHNTLEQPTRASQNSLVDSTLQAKATERHSFSFLLPANFRRYLEEVYFADFDPATPEILSRNTVSHGVAPAEFFSLKGAVLGFLVLDQLSFYIGTESRLNGDGDENSGGTSA